MTSRYQSCKALRQHIAIAITFSLSFGCSNSQTSKNVDYSAGICKCLDSLNKTINIEQSFPICFRLALDRNSSAFIDELNKTYGNSSKESLSKLTDVIEIKASVQLINSCPTFFNFTDSLKHQQYKKLNKDSLRNLLSRLQNTDSLKRNKEYYEYASTLYFQLGTYNLAIENAKKVLSIDSTNIRALFIKASIYDANGDYQKAIELYDKVERFSHQNSFSIYSALAKKKITRL